MSNTKAQPISLIRCQIPSQSLHSKDLDETLASFVESAHDNAWNFRQEALLHNPREPPPAVRVAELLRWAKTDSGKRLLALADIRRHGNSTRFDQILQVGHGQFMHVITCVTCPPAVSFSSMKMQETNMKCASLTTRQ